MKKEKRLPPVLTVHGDSMPEAWENSILKLAKEGFIYRRDDEADNGNQIDSNMTIEIRNPDADPFTHKLGGTNAVYIPLLDYYMEIMGAKDCWIKDFNDPTDTKWDYLYHERLASYPTNPPLNQIEFAINRLIKRPSSRRTNIITWFPQRDTKTKDTPCLQRLWFNMIPGHDGENDTLDMQYNFRSRNVLLASFGNIQGLYMIGCHIRDRVEQATGKNLDLRMIDNTNSYHVSTRDSSVFLANMARFDNDPEFKTLESRTYTRDVIVEDLKLCRGQVEDVILTQSKKYYKGDFSKEEERVHSIGDRIFYLLDKYAPKK
jgi:thymidylate synthase